MKKTVLIITLLVSQLSSSQNHNIVLQVNNEILLGPIANLYVSFQNDSISKNYNLQYYPGELIFNGNLLVKIKEEQNFNLHFDYYSYEKGRQEVTNIDIVLTSKLLDQPYLIINIYDFRSRKYRRRYSCLTDKDYLVQLTFPNSGIYIPCR